MIRILFFAVLLFSLNAQAQVNLGITRFGAAVPNDTVMGGSSESYDVWVKNYGPDPFNDFLFIYTAVRDSSAFGLDTVDTFGAGGIAIGAGDSLSFTLTANYTVGPVGGYRYGIDVIVIWPYASSASTLDSLEFSIYIVEPNGVIELDIKDLIKLYPNPSSDKLSVGNNDASVESISIYDLSGKLIMSNRNQNTINIEGLRTGMYQAEVILSNKKAYHFKIIKQK